MDYQRWSIRERAKWFAWGNAGKLFLGFILFLIAIQFPAHSLTALENFKNLSFDIFAFFETKKDFIFGVFIAVFLNYVKDTLKSSQESKAIGHALREEASHLHYKARYHHDDFAKYYTSLEEIDFGLRHGKESLLPKKIFHGTDYMPIFKANTAKVASLRVRFLYQGDDVISIATRMYEFINEYENLHANYVTRWEQAKQDFTDAKTENKRQEIVKEFYFLRSEYQQRIRGFRDNCSSLSIVLAKYRY